VKREAGAKRRTLFDRMAELAMAAASFLKKRYSGQRGQAGNSQMIKLLCYLRRMITNFEIELGGTKFEFHTMNAVNLNLFQVYVLHDNKRTRFHMQLQADKVFHITDRDKCPEIYLPLASQLHEAIVAHSKSINALTDLEFTLKSTHP
jgi:hypothetical protein